jgi:hypothetical protein
MKVVLSILAIAFSAVLYIWFAAIFLYPICVLGWAEGWATAVSHRSWFEWVAIAGIGAAATILAVGGISLIRGQRPPTNT